MKSALLLETLAQKIDALAAQVLPHGRHATISPRFDRQLFRTRSTQMQAYLEEARSNLTALRDAAAAGQSPQVAWLAEKLIDQISALSREAATWRLRAWDSPAPAVAKWQRKRLEHQEFEKRLAAMRQEREARLTRVETFAQQQLLHKEITALDGRLRRCREALDNIEQVLARLTR